MLLEHGADPNMQCSYSRAALSLFAESGHDWAVRTLLEYGAHVDIQDRDGNTALKVAVEHGCEVVMKTLLEHGADPNIRARKGRTALLSAVRIHHHQAFVKILLEHGADPNIHDDSGCTPLWDAKTTGDETVVVLLLRYGAVLYPQSCDARTTLLSWVAGHDNETTVQDLLEDPTDLNSRDRFGRNCNLASYNWWSEHDRRDVT